MCAQRLQFVLFLVAYLHTIVVECMKSSGPSNHTYDTKMEHIESGRDSMSTYLDNNTVYILCCATPSITSKKYVGL